MPKIKDLDIVALTEDLETTYFETGESIKLYQGQGGTVVMALDGSAFAIKFANCDGKTFAMKTMPESKLCICKKIAGYNSVDDILNFL